MENFMNTFAGLNENHLLALLLGGLGMCFFVYRLVDRVCKAFERRSNNRR